MGIMRVVKALVFLLGSVSLLSAGDATPKVDGNAAFEKMKALVGTWEGTAPSGATQKATQKASFQLIADGSVLASRLSGGMPFDMHTMIHLDDGTLMLTHYCAMHNQPRMTLVPGDNPNLLVFKFKDGTNLSEGGGHMNRVTFTLDGPDHHIEEWTFLKDGHETTSRSDFHRKL
jgi:hypothetical protein